MNALKLAILGLALLFVIITSFLDLSPLFTKVIYGIMACFSILFLFVKRKEFHFDDMFSKNKESQNEDIG